MKRRVSIFRYLFSEDPFVMLILVLWILASSCDKSYSSLTLRNAADYDIRYAAIFVPADPHDSTNAFGNVSATYNTFSHMLDYSIHWNSLTSLPVAIHVNDKDLIMINLPVFPRVITDSISGTAFITSEQADDLASGYVIVMIHTIKYPYGEVMASMNKQ